VTEDEEAWRLETAESHYVNSWGAFIYVALRTDACRGELLELMWVRVDFDQSRIHLTNTKGHKNRYVPIGDDVVDVLRRLQAQTIQVGGPFMGMHKAMQRRWASILEGAEVFGVSPHDLRRSFVTRLVRVGVPLPTVQKLAGNADIKATLEHYNWVSDDDLLSGVGRLLTVASRSGPHSVGFMLLDNKKEPTIRIEQFRLFVYRTDSIGKRHGQESRTADLFVDCDL